MNTRQELTEKLRAGLHADLRAAAQRVAGARHWPDFIAAAYAVFELATRTARALVDASPFEEHIRLAEAERAATDGRDILRAAPGRMNAVGPLGAPIVLAPDHLTVTEADLGRLAEAVADRFAMATDEPLGADELVAFSEAMDAADRLRHALNPSPLNPVRLGRDALTQVPPRTGSTDSTDSAEEADDGDLP